MRGLVILGKWIWAGLSKLISGLVNFKRFIPVSLLGIFIVTEFFGTIITNGINNPNSYMLAVQNLATKIGAAELTIRTNAELALSNSPEYTLYAFYSVCVSVYIIYVLFKFLNKRLRTSQGANENDGSPMWAIAIIALIELTTIRIGEGIYFIPIWDGIIFASMNIGAILTNIHVFS